MIPRLCEVPAGEFIMGGPAEEGFVTEAPPRKVSLDTYFIDEIPVTCQQYMVFVHWMLKTKDHSLCHSSEPKDKDHRPLIFPGTDSFSVDYPITGIDWYDAYAYAAWAGMRLPTEAEWEKAARGCNGRKWPWGNESGLKFGCLQACIDDNFYHPKATGLSGVYQHPNGVSPYGCFDMAGNTWEYCADYFNAKWYQIMPDRNPINDTASNLVVARGGCFTHNEHDAMCAIRIAARPADRHAVFNNIPIGRPVLGFRCASSNPNPIGAIGPMRHLKPTNETSRPDYACTIIIGSDGYEYYDGDEVDEGGLTLGNGEPASLNDFLVTHISAPPLSWAMRFTDVVFWEQAWKGSIRIYSPNHEFERDYQEIPNEGHRKVVENDIIELMESLKNLAKIDDTLEVNLSEQRFLNCHIVRKEGACLIKLNIGLFTVQNAIGLIISELAVNENVDKQKISNSLKSIVEHVLTGGDVGVTSHSFTFSGESNDYESLKKKGRVVCSAAVYSKFLRIFAIAHELGHFKFNHQKDIKAGLEKNWEMEYQADRFALELSFLTKEVAENPHAFAFALGFWFEFLWVCELQPSTIEIIQNVIKNIGKKDSSGGIKITDSHPHAAARRASISENLPAEYQTSFIKGIKLLRNLPPHE